MKTTTAKPRMLIGFMAIAACSSLSASASADPLPVSAAPTSPPSPIVSEVSPTPPSAPSVKRTTVALVAAGVAVAAAGAGAVFGVLALQNKSDYDRGPTYANSDKGNNDAAYADGSFALAVVAGVTSLVLALTSDPTLADAPAAAASKKSGAAFSASPMILPHGGGAGALLRF
jgi:hypothetical protein